MSDGHGRNCRYLRMSITDRCNLACGYCVSQRRERFIAHDKILRYEEFLRLARIASSLGIQKTRITGGEPFARLGLMPFLHSLRHDFPDMRLCITTNATLLEPYLSELVSLGLYSINISLDSFNKTTVQDITGKDVLDLILHNLETLLNAGQRVKINAVAMRGITDLQMGDFIHALHQYPVDFRFIEFMPMGTNTQWNESRFISSTELLDIANQLVELEPAQALDELSGPARMFSVKNAKGRFGFISAVSDHFCARCNRLRITSEGGLRTCLFSDREYRLAPALRNPKLDDSAIAKIFQGAIARKPLGNALLENRSNLAVATRQMVRIGG